MKKRIVAVLLSLTLCMATVVEAGASFDSQASADSAATEFAGSEGTAAAGDSASGDAGGQDLDVFQEEPVVTPEEQEPTPTPVAEEPTPTPETGGADAFSDGTDAPDVTPAEENPAEVVTFGEEPLQAAADVHTTLADGTIVVDADDWVETAAGSGEYKLIKITPAPIAASDDDTQTVVGDTDGSDPAADSTAGDGTLAGEEPAAGEPADTAETVAGEETAASVGEAVPETTETEPETVPAAEETVSGTDAVEIYEEDALTGAAPEYYTAADGLLHIQTVDGTASRTGYYYFDENGVMVTGRQKIAPGTPGYTYTETEEYFFTDASRAVLAEGYAAGTVCTPWNSDLGQAKKNIWIWTGTYFRYYDSGYRFLSVEELKAINTAKGNYKGYYYIDDVEGQEGYYYLRDSGRPVTGMKRLSDVKYPGDYLFLEAENEGDIPGKMFHGGWYRYKTSRGDRWLYYCKSRTTEEEYKKTGLNVGILYRRGIVATKLDTSVMGNYTYLIDSRGYILKSTIKKAENGYYYATNKYGRIYKNKLVTYKGYRYYFGSTGKRATWTRCWMRCAGANNRYYYFGNVPGRVVEKTGWQKITTSKGFIGWFYFTQSGNHYMDKLTSTDYYFKPSGKLAGGINEVNGKTYFFQISNSTTHRGKMFRSTWIRYKNNWYYAGADGQLYKNGWKRIDGNYYYFNSDFTTKTNTFAYKGSTYGYLNSQGKFCTGWVIVSNSQNLVRYVNPDGGGWVKNTSRVIDGLRYYFDSDGYRRNDLTALYGGSYYVTVDRVNCVMTIYDSSKTVPVKSIRVSVGLASTPTPTGTYYLSKSARWQALMGPSWGQYGTHVVGAGQGGIFVHSVSGSSASSYSLPAAEYNKLGTPASHGCIRCCVADAKWVYYNCNGSTIRIFDGAYTANEAMRGPLGRRALVPLQGSMNYDPTDPEV